MSMAAVKIARVTKKAMEVFSAGVVVTEDKLNELVALTSQLTAVDINLDLKRVRRSRVNAPVSYMEIFSSPALTVCVFVLWEGAKMPMHNHPDMYGILKVLHGTVRVQSYSPAAVNNNETSRDSSVDPNWLPSPISKILANEPKMILARKHAPLDVSAKVKNPAVLRPVDGNIHAIECLDGPAAFVDILAPSYQERVRDCEYFQEFIAVNSEVREPLVLLKPYYPRDFWSDRAEYRGPPVRL